MDKDEIMTAIKGMSVLELAELVKNLEEEFGVSAAAPMMAVAPGSATATAGSTPADEEEEQTEFNVLLQDIGPNKINVIKVVRQVTSLGLKEAKELVESAPTAIREGIGKAEADEIKAKVEEAGAQVAVQ